MSDNVKTIHVPAKGAPEIDVSEGKPWDLFPTLFILALIGIGISISSTLVMYGFFLDHKVTDTALTFKDYVKTVDLKNTLVLGATQAAGTIVALILVFLFAWKKQGITISDYLGLKMPRLRDFFIWLGLLFLFMVGIKFLSAFIQQDKNSSDFAVNLVKGSQHFWVIFATVAIAAPLLEEFVMRGFLFQGLLHAKLTDVASVILTGAVSYAIFIQIKTILSVDEGWLGALALILALAALLYFAIFWFYRKFQNKRVLGAVGTVLLTSVFWSLLHTQYGWFNLVAIGGLGILFGMARIYTGSIYVPIFLHAAQNGLAILAVSAMLGQKAAGAG